MALFKINGKDYTRFLSKMRVEYNILTSPESGRNALGDTTVDIVNTKTKLYCEFRAMTADDMAEFLTSVQPYVVNVTYLDPTTKAEKTIKVYTGAPAPEYMWCLERSTYMMALQLNFIEL